MYSQASPATESGHSSDRATAGDQPRWLRPGDNDEPAGPALSRRRIVVKALELTEECGLDALTMRRVASALEVTPMSLYNHVADKAELVDLMVDVVLEDVVAATAQDTGTWEHRLRSLCRRNHEVWKAHPGIVRVYVDGVTIGPNGLADLEYGIDILRRAGFDDQDAGAAVTLLFRWCMAATLPMDRTRPVRRDRPRPSGEVSAGERMDAYFSARPREEIPGVEASVMALSGTSIDFGLDVIIAGLQARLAETRAGKGLGGRAEGGPGGSKDGG